jgi:hypothetical protein
MLFNLISRLYLMMMYFVLLILYYELLLLVSFLICLHLLRTVLYLYQLMLKWQHNICCHGSVSYYNLVPSSVAGDKKGPLHVLQPVVESTHPCPPLLSPPATITRRAALAGKEYRLPQLGCYHWRVGARH